MKHKFLIHTDGGARGNPGPAAAGFVLQGDLIGKKDSGEYLGEITNNEAEYNAVVMALEWLNENKEKFIVIIDKKNTLSYWRVD